MSTQYQRLQWAAERAGYSRRIVVPEPGNPERGGIGNGFDGVDTVLHAMFVESGHPETSPCYGCWEAKHAGTECGNGHGTDYLTPLPEDLDFDHDELPELGATYRWGHRSWRVAGIGGDDGTLTLRLERTDQ